VTGENMSTQIERTTYFGVAAFFTGILCVLALLSNYGVANLNISPAEFNQLNRLTALFFCILTPLAFGLGVVGFTRKNDSKVLSLFALVFAIVPFLFTFAKLVLSFVK
jgi:hypothetical protein